MCFPAGGACASNFYLYHSVKSNNSPWAGCKFAGYTVLSCPTFFVTLLSYLWEKNPLEFVGFGYFEKPFYFLFPALIKGKVMFFFSLSLNVNLR